LVPVFVLFWTKLLILQTTPAKMLNANPGLREICHSITGGALAAQGAKHHHHLLLYMVLLLSLGYWMPYDAARAISATFCWSIRFALTPLFGKDFPDICKPPGSPEYGKMIVKPEIVQQSTSTANLYRNQELESKTNSQRQHQGQRVLMDVSSSRRGGISNATAHTLSKGDGHSLSTTTTSDNSWTPVNPLSPERTKPVRRSEKMTKTTGMLPPVEEMFRAHHKKMARSSQANPLKRRLNENSTENAAVESSSSSAAAGKSRREARPARRSYPFDESSDEDEQDSDDDINLNLTTDDNDSTSSDSDADLDLISDLSMMTSSESDDGENDDPERRSRRRRHHGHSKPQQRKNNKTQHDDSTLSSTTSLQPSQSTLLSKQKHHPRDREAAETLLTLSSRSGSSSVEERPANNSTKQTTDGAATNNTAASKDHAIKRLRRVSF
jgi:hypothetical protein